MSCFISLNSKSEEMIYKLTYKNRKVTSLWFKKMDITNNSALKTHGPFLLYGSEKFF